MSKAMTVWSRSSGSLPENLPLIEPVAAACGDIERVHDPGYLAWLRGQCLHHTDFNYVRDTVYSGGYFEQNTFISGFIDQNTYINPHSYDVATYAAGSAVAAMERALDGTSCLLSSVLPATMLPRHGRWGSAS